MQNYRDSLQQFRESNTQVLGISVDASPSLKEFGAKNGVTFPLLSDFQRTVSRAYGVLSDEGYASRSTFVIDRDGKIRSIERGNSAISADGALAAVKAMK